MQDRQRVARGIVSTVPQLLSAQVETADPAAAEAVAIAIERIAEDLLSWHDRLALGDSGSAPTPTRPGWSDTDDAGTAEEGGDAGTASATLRAGVRRGELPGRPVTLHLAAAELRAVVRRIETATQDAPKPADPDMRSIVDECLCLATALDRHGELLRLEGERLSRATTPEQRDQVLARVVRAERRLGRAAMVTLTP